MPSSRLHRQHHVVSAAARGVCPGVSSGDVVPVFLVSSLLFFFNDTATTVIYTLSLHDALPIFLEGPAPRHEHRLGPLLQPLEHMRSEEHTSELQSPCNLVCRLLLEKIDHISNSTDIDDLHSDRSSAITYKSA